MFENTYHDRRQATAARTYFERCGLTVRTTSRITLKGMVYKVKCSC